VELNLPPPYAFIAGKGNITFTFQSLNTRVKLINHKFITFQCVFIGVGSVIPAGAGLTRSCNTLGSPTNV